MSIVTSEVKHPDATPGSTDLARVTALELVDVWKYFGAAAAVAGCTLSVADAAVVGLIGPNGAGKSPSPTWLAVSSTPTRGGFSFRAATSPDYPPIEWHAPG